MLAGKIVVLKNNASVRKKLNFVLINVWSDVNNDCTLEKGTFGQQEKLNLYNRLVAF
jgi:hypothetical protein